MSMDRLGKVAVLMGGSSSEREVSLMSGSGVLSALRHKGVNAFAFDPAEHDIHKLKQEGFERCFVALHGRGGEDGVIQGALDYLHIPYTGSGVLASSVAMNKSLTKRIWTTHKIPTPAWLELKSREEAMDAFQRFGAMVIKPAQEGSSIGILKVRERSEVYEAFDTARALDLSVLCEQLIVGDELTVAVLNVEGVNCALPAIKIVPPEDNYDFENKYYKNDTLYCIPSGIDSQLEDHVRDIVVSAFEALHCRHWARVDVMIDRASNKPYLLEINTSPGMTTHSLFPMAAGAIGMTYEDLCVHLLELTLVS